MLIIFLFDCFILKSQNNQLSDSLSVDQDVRSIEIRPMLTLSKSSLVKEYFNDIKKMHSEYSIDFYSALNTSKAKFDSIIVIHKIDWDFDFKSIKSILIDIESDVIFMINLDQGRIQKLEGYDPILTPEYIFLNKIMNSLGPFFTSQGNLNNNREYIFDLIYSNSFKSIYIDLKGVLIDISVDSDLSHLDPLSSVLNDINTTKLWVHLDSVFNRIPITKDLSDGKK